MLAEFDKGNRGNLTCHDKIGEPGTMAPGSVASITVSRYIHTYIFVTSIDFSDTTKLSYTYRLPFPPVLAVVRILTHFTEGIVN